MNQTVRGKRLLLIICTVCCILVSFATAITTETVKTTVPAEYEAGYQYENLSHLSGPFVVEDLVPVSPSRAALNTGTGLPSRFDLRTYGWVSPVKNQGHDGTCWVFSTVGSLESTLLPEESWSFSEQNIANLLSNLYPEGFDRNYSRGGNFKKSTAYLARWSGPIKESDDPYNPKSSYSPTDKPVQKHVQNVLFIPVRKNALDNNNIKTAVRYYGTVAIDLYMDEKDSRYWNKAHNSYYYDGTQTPGHDVEIVGWDDGWSRNNFSTVPPGDGAFIIKNSWGTGWGDAGYFYASYYDMQMAKTNGVAVFIAEPTMNYNHIYQYDPLGWVSSINTGNGKTGWAANIFTSTRNENLSAVSFYTTDTGTAYEICVYRNPNNGPVLNSSGPVWTTKGTFYNAGYHTVPMGQEIPLHPNDRFSVAVKLTNPSFANSIPIEQWVSGDTTKAKASPGQGFISTDGVTWTDLTANRTYRNASVCIKAFTRDPVPDSNVAANAARAPNLTGIPLNPVAAGMALVIFGLLVVRKRDRSS